MDGSSAIPHTMEDIETLVKRLYQPGHPRTIILINDQLQRLQNSPDAWQIADSLLNSQDPHVRFFAAQTFIVKLNNDGSTLDAETAQSVQTRLVSWLVRLVNQGETGLVTKKFSSTLTTYYLRSPIQWKRPILHLALSMQNGDPASEPDENATVSMGGLCKSLSESQLIALLWFAATLADEVGRMENNTPALAQRHVQMEIIVEDASSLLKYAFSQGPDGAGAEIRSEALRCYITWVNYAQPVWPQKPDCLEYLRQLIPIAAQCLIDPALQRDALDSFRDILESYTSFFRPEHMRMLSSVIAEHVQPVLLQCLEDKDPDGLPYGQMVIAFGDANITQVVERPDDVTGSETILKLLFDILKAPGYPGDEDELSTLSIEFWNTYIEYVNDMLFSKDQDEPDPPWFDYCRSVLSQLVGMLWTKLVTPPPETAKQWTDAESDGFKEFRLDTTDLMLSMYVFLGKDMLQQLITLTIGALDTRQWRGVEAGMFCLHMLADNVLEDQPSEDLLATVFSSSLFRDVADFGQNMPTQVRRTAIDLLGSYGQYIEHHAEYLPDTVRFLFASLETGSLANAAAKSIASLCSACRGSLTGELEGFLQQYQRFLSGPTNDPYTKEKVIGAIASIIQAIQPDTAKVQPLVALVQYVEQDVQVAKDCAQAGEEEMAGLMGVAALNCLASIGKGMQVPDDVPVSIYEDDESPPNKDFWALGEGQVAQQRIMGCFSVLQVLGNNGEAVEAACQVLRTGFAETEPGPFVLPPSVTVSFLQQCAVTTPQLEAVLGTVCILITQHSKGNSTRIGAQVTAVTQQVMNFIQQLGGPGNDPAVATSCIDVLGRLMPYYTSVLFDDASPVAPGLQTLLDFTIQGIDGADPFPKRSALDFWTKVIKPQTAPVPDQVVARMKEIVAAYGPQLALTLMRQITGLAQRSELDYVCEPLKALITNQPASKGWLEAALKSDMLPTINPAVGDREKQRFLQQIVGLRGDTRKTREVVKEFYAACRGTVVSYGS
ncbi:hypothetical protein D0865_10229 [Hortaea werneckii]|uniref:Importin N-terminal domain-containing protein n=1 Tax=Hortaea werneckii TaxID=91943 RepID=A0A3M7BZJ7_HORWE|nr:hypothetical protein D0865_10229 [Hortaea werneckii]